LIPILKIIKKKARAFFFIYLVGIWCGIMFTNDIGEVV